MKIVVVQDHLRSGGTERQSVLLANAFAAAGHAATLLTFRPGGALAATVAPDVAERALQPFDTRLDWFAPGLGRTIARLQPDVILCMGRMANCQGRRLAAVVRRRAPRALVIGTMRTGRRLSWRFRSSLLHARHLIANSQAAKLALVGRLGIPAEKISVIPNSLVFPDSWPGEFRVRDAQPGGPVILLNVAMFRPGKNQRELIELCAALPAATPDWQLWLAGDGPARPACERLVWAQNLGARVRFLGWQKDPSPLYRAGDLAVLASQTESLSNFLCEAQAHGLPAVAYDVAGVGECFLPGRSGHLVPNRDRAAFTARLAGLIADAAERARFSAAARDFARAAFDPARQVQAHLDLFAQLAAAAGRTP